MRSPWMRPRRSAAPFAFTLPTRGSSPCHSTSNSSGPTSSLKKMAKPKVASDTPSGVTCNARCNSASGALPRRCGSACLRAASAIASERGSFDRCATARSPPSSGPGNAIPNASPKAPSTLRTEWGLPSRGGGSGNASSAKVRSPDVRSMSSKPKPKVCGPGEVRAAAVATCPTTAASGRRICDVSFPMATDPGVVSGLLTELGGGRDCSRLGWRHRCSKLEPTDLEAERHSRSSLVALMTAAISSLSDMSAKSITV
mmetsp:Transcript_73518/g.204267  ORF Transcript_73518/g.204267 Transcript_73518/m.204267 type:complete len:257 (+) Transcript_73518:615-1385(+)